MGESMHEFLIFNFYFDRISMKEGIDLECYNEQYDKVLNETISKRCNSCRVVLARIVSTNEEPVTDVTKCC